MTRLSADISGRWRIIAMDLWDREAVEMDGPAYVDLRRDGTGVLHFVAVDAELDCEPSTRDGRPVVDFTFEGVDDGENRCGRGWLRLAGPDELEGYLWFHLGDKSGFRATRWGGRKGSSSKRAAKAP